MNVSRVLISFALSALVTVPRPGFSQSLREQYREKAIGPSQVPRAAIDAAQKALGTAPTEAKLIQGPSPQEYELEAPSKSGEEMSVHMLENGTVIRLEHEKTGKD